MADTNKNPAPKNPTPTPRKGWLRRMGGGGMRLSGAMMRQTAGWVLTVVVVLLLALSAGLLFLQTDKGMDWLGRTVSSVASSDDLGVDIRFTRLSLTQVTIPHIRLSDAKGVFLEVDDLDVAIDAASYALLRPVLEYVRIGRVDLQRLPDLPAAPQSTPAASGPPSLPQIAAEIRAFDIAEIRTGPAVYGHEQFFHLTSRFILSPRLADNDIRINLEAADGRAAAATTHLKVSIGMADDDNLRADISFYDAAGGMMTRLAGLPRGYDVDFKLKGEGPPRDWRGAADMRLGKELSGRFLLHMSDNSRLRIDADLKGPRKVEVKGYIDLPLQLTPPDISPRAKIDGMLATNIDLRSMTLLAGLDDHRLTGNAKVNLRVAGTLQQPLVDGSVTVRGATYENLASGVKLTSLNVDVAVTRSDVKLTSLSAKTPGGGSLKAEAAVSLRDLANPSFSFSAQADHAQVAGLQNAQVFASGKVSGKGDKAFADISGDIVIDKAEIYLAGFGSGSAASMLNITEVNVPPHLRRQKRAFAVPQAAYPVNLDVRVNAPRAIFVRGQGLDSEWSAKVHVRGTAAEPQVDGVLKMLRGRYEFFDALMTFTTGTIDFSAGNMTNPDLDIKGSIKGKQVTANVAVSGTAQAPEVTLTSEPALPQDEILSRVFFDKSVTELSPMEMVRIAQIIGVMSGHLGGGGMDPISQLRKKAGIDMFSLNRDDATGATSVSVGKYLSDGVYMSVDQGVNTEGSAVKLQIELRPNLQLETRVGNDDDNSVGVNWKKDY